MADKDYLEQISERLFDLRDGRTYKVIHENTGIHQNTLRSYEHSSMPSSENLNKLADYYKVSIDYILCRTDFPFSHGALQKAFTNNFDLDYEDLLAKLRGLNDAQRKAILQIISIEIRSNDFLPDLISEYGKLSEDERNMLLTVIETTIKANNHKKR